MIVSEIPGTTRDSIDVRFEKGGKTFLVIDTAGVRKKAKITRDDLEFYAFHRAQRSIRRADVVFMLIDATVDMGDVDQKLAAYVAEEFRPCVIVINKWDLVAGRVNAEQYEEYIGKILPLLEYAPMAFISAKAGENVDELVRLAQVMYEQAGTRLGTGQLNTAVEEILALRGPELPDGPEGEGVLRHANRRQAADHRAVRQQPGSDHGGIPAVFRAAVAGAAGVLGGADPAAGARASPQLRARAWCARQCPQAESQARRREMTKSLAQGRRSQNIHHGDTETRRKANKKTPCLRASMVKRVLRGE